MQLSQRYVKFDLQQLLKAAISALSDKGAHHCTRVLKLREGLNSKAFLLTMDNGLEIIARLPNPIAGPAYYTTASEVATCEFVCSSIINAVLRNKPDCFLVAGCVGYSRTSYYCVVC